MSYICTMNHEGDFLKQWLKKHRKSAPKLAKELGLAKSSVYYQLDLEQLSSSFIEKLEDKGFFIFQNNTENSSITVAAEPTTPYQKLKPNAAPLPDGLNIIKVPLVQEYAYAGYLSGYTDNHYIQDLPTIPFITEKQPNGNYMAFQVRGDSMNDGSIDSYQHGDIVLCRAINKVHWLNKLHIHKWDFIIVHQTEGILLKKIIEHNASTGQIKIHSLNPFFDDTELNLNDVSQLFNIIKIERKK